MPQTNQIFRWHEVLYDTQAFAAAATLPQKIQFFTQAQGEGTSPTVGSGTKTVADTNLDRQRQLPSRYNKFVLMAIRVSVMGSTGLPVPADTFSLFKNFIGQLIIDATLYTNGPLELFPAGGGMQSVGQLSTAGLAITDSTFGVLSGQPTNEAIFKLAEPITIPQGSTFEFDLVGNTGVALVGAGATSLGRGLLIRTILEGKADRAATA
jgi:hypothetical protein